MSSSSTPSSEMLTCSQFTEMFKLYEAASDTTDPSYAKFTEKLNFGVSPGPHIASCMYSFKIHKDVLPEHRADILRRLFDHMTRRVDEAFSGLPPQQ